MYETVLRSVIYPLTQLAMGRPTLKLLQQLEATQHWSPGQLRVYQWERLRAMLKHAYAHTPYYRRQFDDAGLAPADIQSPDDLTRLPILTKEDIRQNISDMMATDIQRPVTWVKTSGSTGEPLVFALDKLTEAHGAANAIRCHRWWEIDVGDRGAYFWRGFYSFHSMRSDQIRRRLKNRLMNRRVFSVYDMSPRSMDRYYQISVRFRPKFILGYSSALFAFARYLQERKLDARHLGLTAVIATAEAIFPAQARLIDEVFGCPVVNEYGASEVGIIAYQCPAGAWHAMDETFWIEVAPIEQNDTLGEILITHLTNFACPMIRYRVGDLAPLHPATCDCGLGLSTIGPVKGRSHDLLVTPDGRFIHGEFLVHIFDTIGAVSQFRVIQHAPEQLEIEFVSTQGLAEDQEQFLRDQIAKFMGRTIMVELRPVQAIQQEPSGKLRFIISHVARATLERPA